MDIHQLLTKDFSFLNLEAIEYLEKIGIRQPDQRQIDLMEKLLAHHTLNYTKPLAGGLYE